MGCSGAQSSPTAPGGAGRAVAGSTALGGPGPCLLPHHSSCQLCELWIRPCAAFWARSICTSPCKLLAFLQHWHYLENGNSTKMNSADLDLFLPSLALLLLLPFVVVLFAVWLPIAVHPSHSPFPSEGKSEFSKCSLRWRAAPHW